MKWSHRWRHRLISFAVCRFDDALKRLVRPVLFVIVTVDRLMRGRRGVNRTLAIFLVNPHTTIPETETESVKEGPFVGFCGISNEFFWRIQSSLQASPLTVTPVTVTLWLQWQFLVQNGSPYTKKSQCVKEVNNVIVLNNCRQIMWLGSNLSMVTKLSYC